MLQEIRLAIFGHEFPIYGYGLMLVAAFLACVTTGKWLGRHSRIDPELFVNAALIALITGVIGARLCHVLENLSQYTRADLSVWQNFRNIINIREGGLTFYGGFLLATPCCIAYARIVKVPIKLGMDIVAPVLMLGLGLGRVGCYLNGCCYGQECAWGVRFPYYSNAYLEQFRNHEIDVPDVLKTKLPDGVYTPMNPHSAEFQNSPAAQQAAQDESNRARPVQPTELYSALTGFLLAGVLIAYFTLPHVDGRVFALMLMLEGAARFLLETIRVEPAVWTVHLGNSDYGFSISMFLGLFNVLAGALMWHLVGRYSRVIRFGPKEETPAPAIGLPQPRSVV